MRAGVPVAVAGAILATSFGVLARDAGLSTIAAVAMSAIVFAGAAQFTAVTILAAGGGVGAAIVGATLMNSRYLPMGIALAPSLPGGRAARATQAQAVVDASWAMALRDGGRFDRFYLFGATLPQYVAWTLGTLAGAIGGDLIGDTDALGLDAVYPAFFAALLLAEVRDGRARGAAALGAAIALVLVPFAPAGVPVLAASAAALIGIAQRTRGPAAGDDAAAGA